MTGPKHITVDPQGNLHEVIAMFNRHGQPTDECSLASTCVVFFHGNPISQDADDVPIYTVH
jgi:hypothetical protein